MIAWGGDGTINEVASALAFGRDAARHRPAGSGNGLARDARRRSPIPARAIADALPARAARRSMPGELGGRLFFNVAGVGFDAHVAARFDRDRHRRRGLVELRPRSPRASCSRYRPRTLRDRRRRDRASRALLVTLANSAQFGNGARIAPGAASTTACWIWWCSRSDRACATLCAVPRLFNGDRRARAAACRSRRVEHVTIEGDQPMTASRGRRAVSGGPTARGPRPSGRAPHRVR